MGSAHQDDSPELTVTFHLTHNCNIRCSYCYTGEKFGRGMTDETADQAVDFALALVRDRGVSQLNAVFFGGEPLLRKDLLLRIADRLLEEAPVPVTLKTSTNGLLLTEEVVGELVARGLFVSISMDGTPKQHDRQRRDIHGRGTSSRLGVVVDSLLREIPSAHVNCVVTPQSAGSLDESVAWLSDRGFMFISTSLDYGDPGWTRADLTRLAASYGRLAKWYERRTREGRKFYLSGFDNRIRSRTWGPVGDGDRCAPGESSFSIAPSGRIYPCIQFVGEDNDHRYAIGDVRTGLARDAKTRVPGCSRDECRGCALLDRCGSGCACVNMQAHGDPALVSALVCEHERLLMPIVDRMANRLWRKRNAAFLRKHYDSEFPLVNFVEEVILREAMAGPTGGAA